MRPVSRPRVPGSGPGKRRQQKSHWQAMLAQGDALAAAVEQEHAMRHGSFEACAMPVCIAARAWREARGPA